MEDFKNINRNDHKVRKKINDTLDIYNELPYKYQ